VLRQQNIFRTFECDKNSSAFKSIYKDRCKKYYDHSYFNNLINLPKEQIVSEETVILSTDMFANKKRDQDLKKQKRERCLDEDDLKANFKQTLEWVTKIQDVRIEEESSPQIRINMKKGKA
jgi:hypothetical protein